MKLPQFSALCSRSSGIPKSSSLGCGGQIPSGPDPQNSWAFISGLQGPDTVRSRSSVIPKLSSLGCGDRTPSGPDPQELLREELIRLPHTYLGYSCISKYSGELEMKSNDVTSILCVVIPLGPDPQERPSHPLRVAGAGPRRVQIFRNSQVILSGLDAQKILIEKS